MNDQRSAQRIGICLDDYEMFWWRADDDEACPVCSRDDEDYAENHRFFVAENAPAKSHGNRLGFPSDPPTDDERG